jgi:hypothetical protein
LQRLAAKQLHDFSKGEQSMRLQADFPGLFWEETKTRYRPHQWFKGLRLDSKSELTHGLCTVHLKTRYGKSDQSKYLIGLDIKLTHPQLNLEETPLVVEQYKSLYPYSQEVFKFCVHFPHKTISGLWLMVGVK